MDFYLAAQLVDEKVEELDCEKDRQMAAATERTMGNK